MNIYLTFQRMIIRKDGKRNIAKYLKDAHDYCASFSGGFVNCFFNCINLYSITSRHVAIIPKASKKNIPLVSPNEILRPIIILMITRINRSPHKINMKAFDGLK